MSKALYKNPKIEVKKSKLHGFGVFAKANIKSGEILEQCCYVVFNKSWEQTPKELKDYIFYFGRKYKRNESVIVLGFGSIFNHKGDSSATWYVKKKRGMFEFVAIKDIKKGEEIFVNYGEEYWDGRKTKAK